MEPTSTLVPAAEHPDSAVSPGWPLATRLGLGSVQPGGPAGSARLIAALELAPGDRVVDLAPGSGETGLRATTANLYSWTGICANADAVQELVRAVPGPVTVPQLGTPAATGLPDASASVVISEGLLFGIPDDRKAAVIHEAVRLLRPYGRIGLHELCLRDVGLSADSTAELRRRLADAGDAAAYPLTEAEWRALVTGAGLEIVSVAHVPMDLPGAREVVKRLGPRRGLPVLGRAASGETGAAVRRVRRILGSQSGRFSGIVVVARRPYIGRLRHAGGEHAAAE